MPDPGALISRFLAGSKLAEAGIDVSADRMPVMRPAIVSPADFYIANGGSGGGSSLTTEDGDLLTTEDGDVLTTET